MPERHRQHTRGQAVSAIFVGSIQLGGTAQITQQAGSAILAVQEQHRVFSTATRVGGQHCLEFDTLITGAGVAKAQGAARTDCAAGATTHAQVGIDLDLLAATVTADG